MSSAQIYISNTKYHKAVDRLEAQALNIANQDADPMEKEMVRTHIIEVLGDLGIWPAGCLEDLDADNDQITVAA